MVRESHNPPIVVDFSLAPTSGSPNGGAKALAIAAKRALPACGAAMLDGPKSEKDECSSAFNIGATPTSLAGREIRGRD